MDDLKKKAAGKRGKYAEGKVRDFLVSLKERKTGFDFERKYDARSAGGRFPAQAGDFGFFTYGLHGLIEVKEVDHAVRLPEKNFSSEQRAKLQLRALAGGLIVVLVYHTPLKAWRVPPPWAFSGERVPSWDLSRFPTYKSVQLALETVECDGGFPFV